MRITLEIAERGPFAGGAAFGEAGAYERLAGKIRLNVDPAAAHNRVIVDLDKAARGADGLVECVADRCPARSRSGGVARGAPRQLVGLCR